MKNFIKKDREYFAEIYRQIRSYMEERQHFQTPAQDYEITIVEDCGKDIMIRLMNIQGEERFSVVSKDYFATAVNENRLLRYNGCAFYNKHIAGEERTEFFWDGYRFRVFDPEVGQWQHLSNMENAFLGNGQLEWITQEDKERNTAKLIENFWGNAPMAYETYEENQLQAMAEKLAEKFNVKTA